MKNTGLSTYKVAATYVGTIIGAGFASGQEILQFFSIFGYNGLIGLLIVTILFVIFGYIVMEFGYKLNSKSYREIIMFIGGKFFGTIIDWVITFFLFVVFTAMLAGAGALVSQQLNISLLWGSIIMATAVAITVITGLKGIVNSMSFVVPFLLLSALGIGVASIFFIHPSYQASNISINVNDFIQNWFWAAILYTSSNLVLAIGVLGPLGSRAKDLKTIRNGALLGGLGIGIGAIIIYYSVLRDLVSVINIEIPMAYIAGQISYPIQIVYIVVLLVAVYTTAVGSLYGFVSRIRNIKPINNNLLVISVSLLAFIASQFGFSNFVKYLYSSFGYGGFILLVCLLIGKFRRNSTYENFDINTDVKG